MSTFEPPLTCQELSKQCNDVDSSSSQLCGRLTRRSLRKNVSNGSYQPSMYRKVSVGSVSQMLEQCSGRELTGIRLCHNRLEDFSKEFEMLDEQSLHDDDDDDDDDDDHNRENEDWDNCQRGVSQCSAYKWIPQSEEGHDNQHEHQDFLDEIESTFHSQVDDEIEVFRSNLHSMISQQHHQSRQLWNQELEESISSIIPSHTHQQASSPGQTVPHHSGSQDTWSSDFLQNSQDQQKIEPMSTSTSSIQEDQGALQYLPSIPSNNGSLDEELNRLSLQLLTSALTISNALHREQYTI